MNQSPTLWQVFTSVMRAFFGVQHSKNQERDFQGGRPAVFVIMGLVMGIFFVGGIAFVVKLVLINASP